jgi:hypothetical protein
VYNNDTVPGYFRFPAGAGGGKIAFSAASSWQAWNPEVRSTAAPFPAGTSSRPSPIGTMMRRGQRAANDSRN